jgi:protein-arginine kinase activator protein McsA
MRYTYEELHAMTVGQLREIAAGIEDDRLRGHTQMHKEQIVPLLCEVLGIEAHAHHEIVGINKPKVKAEIRELRLQRDAAIEAKDYDELKRIRRRIHRLKGRLRRATV